MRESTRRFGQAARETQLGEGRGTRPETCEGEAGQRREPPPLRHLRKRSRYLVDGGFVRKTLDIGMVVVGVLFNMLILLPVPLAAALLSLALYKSDLLGDYNWAREANRWLLRLDAPWSIVLLVLLGLTALGLLLYPWLKKLELKSIRKKRESALGTWTKVREERKSALGIWTKVFPWVVGLTLFALAWWNRTWDGKLGYWLRNPRHGVEKTEKLARVTRFTMRRNSRLIAPSEKWRERASSLRILLKDGMPAMLTSGLSH
jgi:hypothetical protein